MYDFLVRKAADLWAGTAPSEVRLYVNGESNEYLRGQVELIMELGIVRPGGRALDPDHMKALIARDIRVKVRDLDRPFIPVRS